MISLRRSGFLLLWPFIWSSSTKFDSSRAQTFWTLDLFWIIFWRISISLNWKPNKFELWCSSFIFRSIASTKDSVSFSIDTTFGNFWRWLYFSTSPQNIKTFATIKSKSLCFNLDKNSSPNLPAQITIKRFRLHWGFRKLKHSSIVSSFFILNF